MSHLRGLRPLHVLGVLAPSGGLHQTTALRVVQDYSICAIILSMAWTVETLNHTVDEELSALPADMRARFTRVVRLIESFGVDRVGQPHVKHLQGRVWEMRLQGRDGIARALYVTVIGQRVVVVRVFVKKTQKTPRREIELVLERAKEILS